MLGNCPHTLAVVQSRQITGVLILSEMPRNLARIAGRSWKRGNAEDRDDRQFKRMVERVIGRRWTTEWKFRDRF
jgi:hypothetical protein